jgi:hypothetical protein
MVLDLSAQCRFGRASDGSGAIRRAGRGLNHHDELRSTHTIDSERCNSVWRFVFWPSRKDLCGIRVAPCVLEIYDLSSDGVRTVATASEPNSLEHVFGSCSSPFTLPSIIQILLRCIHQRSIRKVEIRPQSVCFSGATHGPVPTCTDMQPYMTIPKTFAGVDTPVMCLERRSLRAMTSETSGPVRTTRWRMLGDGRGQLTSSGENDAHPSKGQDRGKIFQTNDFSRDRS